MSTLRVDTITDEAGTGAPNFPNGMTGDASSLSGLPEPFGYTAVSGVTQALDVGSHNFFDAGTLTADTTVSFSNVPTEARWSYSFEVGFDATTAWGVSSSVYSKRLSVALQATAPMDVFFKSDGTKMYVLDQVDDDLIEYNLSKPWDISTASYNQFFHLTASETNASGIFFKPDGTKMYSTCQTQDRVAAYNLSTAWDISTASWGGEIKSVSAQDTNPTNIFFKPDGTKMYIIGYTGDAVYEYNLSTAWVVSTASYSQSFSVSSQENTPQGLSFKPDGTKMYIIGQTNNTVYEFNLSTAWDISTSSYNQSFSVVSEATSSRSVFFKEDGTTMYVSDADSDAVIGYSVADTYTLTFPASIENSPTKEVSIGDRVTYDFFTADSGTTVTLIDEEIT